MLVLSGLACPWPGAVSAGAGAVRALLLSAYTLAAFGDSSPPCSLPSLSVVPFCASPARPAIIQTDVRGRGVSDFALLSFVLSPFSLLYPPFSSVFRLICSVILSFCLSDSPILSFFFYTIAARLMPGRAPLWAFIAGFSRGRVVRCITSAFSRGRARI